MTAITTEAKTADAFVVRASDMLGYLYSRWQDEREYEDIKEYQLPLDKIATEFVGLKITRMNKRPFGCDFTVDGQKFRAAVTSRDITLQSWRAA
jgi:hypothetical protein